MKETLARILTPTLVVIIAQLVINSRPVSVQGDLSGIIFKGCIFLALLLMTSFVGGLAHAALLKRRTDVSLSACFLDGAMIGLIANLTVQFLSIVAHGSSLDRVLPPSGGADPVWGLSKLFLSLVIVMIYGLSGLVSGGIGGGLVGLLLARSNGRSSRQASTPEGV